MPLIFKLKVRREVLVEVFGRTNCQAATFCAHGGIFWPRDTFSIAQSCTVETF